LFLIDLVYDVGSMDWSNLWPSVSNWDTLTFDKACKMD